MLKIKNFTIGAILADTQCYSLAENAIQNTKKIIELNDVIVFTDNLNLGNSCNQHLIPKITSIEDYNNIIINLLPKYAISDFYLIIQYDGFPISAINFNPIFLDYDYIGAIWPQYKSYNVGNGGFSLRSRKLINAVAEYAHLRNYGESEDIFICRTIRNLLEKNHNIHFAPENIAKIFSREAWGQPIETFGFHGFYQLPIVYSDNLSYFFKNIPDSILYKKISELIWGSLLLTSDAKLIFDIELAKRLSSLNLD